MRTHALVVLSATEDNDKKMCLVPGFDPPNLRHLGLVFEAKRDIWYVYVLYDERVRVEGVL